MSITKLAKTRQQCRILREEYEFIRGQGMPHVYTVEHLAKLYGIGVHHIENTVGSYSDNRAAFN